MLGSNVTTPSRFELLCARRQIRRELDDLVALPDPDRDAALREYELAAAIGILERQLAEMEAAGRE